MTHYCEILVYIVITLRPCYLRVCFDLPWSTRKTMFKKKSALNVRPQPPSFAEITEDINSADNNDIIFAQSNYGMLHCWLFWLYDAVWWAWQYACYCATQTASVGGFGLASLPTHPHWAVDTHTHILILSPARLPLPAMNYHLPKYIFISKWYFSVHGQDLRSADVLTCATERTRTLLGDSCFSVAGPCLWNSLSVALRDRDITCTV